MNEFIDLFDVPESDDNGEATGQLKVNRTASSDIHSARRKRVSLESQVRSCLIESHLTGKTIAEKRDRANSNESARSDALLTVDDGLT